MGTKRDMKCDDAYRYICDNLDADLDSPRCQEVFKHLQSCPDCTALLDSVRKTVYLYRSVPSPKVPAAARKRLSKTIDFAWKAQAKRRRSGAR